MKSDRRLVVWRLVLVVAFVASISIPSWSDELLSPQEIARLSTAQQAKLLQLIEPLQQAQSLYEQGRYVEFLPKSEVVYRGLIEVFGKHHRLSALALTLRGGALSETGSSAVAVPILEEALAVQQKLLGEAHPETATTRFILGNSERMNGRLESAADHLNQCLQTRLKLFGASHVDTAETIQRLGDVELSQGRPASALTLFEQALQTQTRALGDQSAAVGVTSLGIGLAKYCLGDFLEARDALSRSLEIRRKTLGDSHVDTGRTRYWIGITQQAMGDTDSAIASVTDASNVFSTSLGDRHEATLNTMSTLGELYQAKGDLKRAESLLVESLKRHLETAGANQTSEAGARLSLGRLRQVQGRLDEAEVLFKEAAKVYEATAFEKNPFRVVPLISQMHLQIERQNYPDVRSLAGRIVETLKQSDFAELADLPATLTDLALAQWKTGQFDQCSASLDAARRQIRRMAIKTLPGLTEREVLLCMKHVDESLFNRTLEIGVQLRETPGMLDMSANWVVNGKGMVEESLVRQFRSQRVGGGGVPNALNDEEWIEHTFVREVLPEGSLVVDIVRLDPRGTATFSPWPDSSEPHYVAWLMSSLRDRDVKIVDLGNADSIDRLVAKVRKELIEAAPHGESKGSIAELGDVDSTKALLDSMKLLSEKLLDPLKLELEGIDTLLISPDASLWLVPWNALPLENEAFLIEKFALRFLITSRDLLHFEAEAPPFSTSVLFANPDFDLTEAARQAATRAVLRKEPAANEGGAPNSAKQYRDAVIREIEAKNVDPADLSRRIRALLDREKAASQKELEEKQSGLRGFKPTTTLPKAQRLPGTALEAELIKPKVAELSRSEPIVYADIYALESVFKALHSPQCLVMSTHGFFLNEASSGHQAALVGSGLGANGLSSNQTSAFAAPTSNPLLRCGLLLAGCNDGLNTPFADDGVLTGKEIAQADLNGTRLVVLSACETGLGEIRNGDGVAGLRQAFRLAGARAVVSSLWQVPDRDSALLMNGFFQQASSGAGYAKALQQAQIERIEARRNRFGAAHPFYWAAWTLTGD